MSSGDTSHSHDFQALFDASPNAYVVLDRDFTIVEANEAYLNTVGREREEIVGDSLFDVFPGDPSHSEDPNARRLKASFERVLSTGKQDTLALIPYAIPRETSDGTEYEERYWSATHTPIFGEDGSVDYILQHTTDVTELYEKGFYEEEPEEEVAGTDANQSLGEAQGAELDGGEQTTSSKQNAVRETPTSKQLEEGVLSRAEEVQRAYWNSEEERERLQRLFDQAPGFMTFLSGADHVFELANEAYSQLVGHRDIIGKPVREALPEVVEQGFPELLERVYESGEPFVGREEEIRLQREPQGPMETVYLDFIYQPVTGPEGEVTGIFVQGHDVTEQKEAKDTLREQKAALEELTETLEERVEERTREVRELTSKVTRVEQQERQRIGQDLHDGLASDLTGANIKLSLLSRKVEGDVAEEIEDVQETIQESISDVRRLSRGLNPGGLSEGDLSSALEGLSRSIEGARFEDAFDLEMLDLDASTLEEEVATHLYRIAQEAVSNARRHSEASEITIHLGQEEGALLLKIEDNGKGFDPNEKSEGLGLRSMRRRAEFLGAELTVESNPGEGSSVECRLPV